MHNVKITLIIFTEYINVLIERKLQSIQQKKEIKIGKFNSKMQQ